MKVYDAMAGRYGFGPSRILSREETLSYIPALHAEGLNGGVQYYDGKFDDARYLVHLARSAVEQGATLLNYARVVGLTKSGGGLVTGLVVEDAEGGKEHVCKAKVVINATGPFTDGILRLDDPGAGSIIAPSQGVHLVFDTSFLAGDAAIMVPHTPDDRVMFAIPWHDHVVVGTTDHAVEQASLEPAPTEQDIDFILDTAGRYLERRPTRADVRSAFAGIRPLVAAHGSKETAVLSREHTIQISRSGLVTICGGKWTTYRHMAEEVVGHAETVAGLEERPCVTKQLKLHGFHENADSFGALAVYGSDAPGIRALCEAQPDLDRPLHGALPYLKAEVVWAARHEMALTVDDCLARRTRALFLNARAAWEMSPEVASLLAAERGKDQAWAGEQVRVFRGICNSYMVK
jgi:glycerol-3-phosphate dehydrogenase